MAEPDWSHGSEALAGAARVAIDAARSFLDAAEKVVADPEALAGIVTVVGNAARALFDASMGAAGGSTVSGQRAGENGVTRDDGVEHIDVD